jgi:hypothetical protein
MYLIENEKIRRDTQTQRQQGDLIILLTKIRRGYKDRRTDGKTDIQQGDLISLLLFFSK